MNPPAAHAVGLRTFFASRERGIPHRRWRCLAAQATTRPTRDLDFFTAAPGTVLPALESLEAVSAARGWTVERRQVGETFCRITVHGPDDVDVDLALDASPGMEPSMTVIGPTYAPEELAARKLLALFGRGYPRDFADVFVLAQRFEQGDDVSAGSRSRFEPDSARRDDRRFGAVRRRTCQDDPIALRAFYARWLDLELSHATTRDTAPSRADRTPPPASARPRTCRSDDRQARNLRGTGTRGVDRTSSNRTDNHRAVDR
jgi:hypothetical protein